MSQTAWSDNTFDAPPPLASPVARSLAETLSHEATLLRVLADALPDLIYVKDAQSRYTFNNRAHLRFLGAASADEVLGKSVLDLFPGELAGAFYEDEQAIIRSGEALVDKEEETRDHLGRHLWVSTTKVPLRDAGGRVVGLVGISRDITARKHAEDEARRATVALEAEHAGLVEALRLLEASNEELARAQVTLADMTKHQTVGALAAGIVHEVKNPLAVMGVGLEYLAAQLQDSASESVQMVMRNMRRAVDNANAVVTGLLEFCRPGRLTMGAVPLAVPVEKALLLLRYELAKRRVEAVADLAPALPAVRGDATRIEQVFINLVANAAHAIGDGGGRVTVTARAAGWDGARTATLAPGEAVVIVTVDDTGPGLPDDHVGKVFDPFFTTKPSGEGTGLGLTVVRQIMDLHEGTVRIGNRPDGGARVTLVFKACPATEWAESYADCGPDAQAGGRRGGVTGHAEGQDGDGHAGDGRGGDGRTGAPNPVRDNNHGNQPFDGRNPHDGANR